MKFLVILSLIFLPSQIFAQEESSMSEKGVIEITPSIPTPGESVTATVRSSFYSDLKKSNIVWTVNGAEKKREVGGISFQFTAPTNGSATEIYATVEKESGYIFAGYFILKTAEIDLIYEANTYTPPFYKGRSLFTDQSVVTVLALANLIENGSKLQKNKIIYNWYKNDQKISEFSGVGKDSISIQGGIVSRPFYISVLTESINSGLKAKKKILINPTAPKVVLYENNPIYGSIFEKALTGMFNFDREEVGITAIPYFFSVKNKTSGSLKYSWFENGELIGDETFGSFINYLNPKRSLNGISNIGVSVEHSENFLQSGMVSFKINVLGIQQSDTIETTNATSPF